MTVTGTVANINAALDGLTFMPTLSFNGSAFLTLTTDDQDPGGALTDGPDLTTITVTPVNNAPSGTNKTIAMPQDTARVFTVADFGFTDVDVGDTMSAVRIDALSLPPGATLQLSGVDVLANDVIAEADITAGNLIFTPALGASGVPYAGFTFSVRDTGGAFDPSPDTMTLNVVTAVNNPPDGADNTVSTPESTDHVFTVAEFGFTDIDGDAMLAARIDTLSIPGGAALKWLGANVNPFDVIPFADIVAGALVFTPAPGATGNSYASFSFSVQDTAGNFDSAANQMTIDVTPAGAPANTVPGAKTVDEDTVLAIGGISVNDPSGDLDTVQLAVTNGTLTVSLAGGATISAGLNGSPTLTLSGSQGQINAALATLSYLGNPNYAGPDALTVTSTDLASNVTSSAVAITVNPVNDGPTATITLASYNVTEGNALSLAGTGLSVSDIDSGISSVTVTLSVNAGLLFVTAGPTVSVTGSGTPVVTLSGQVTEIDAVLAGIGGTVTYLIGSDSPPPTDTLTLWISDNGATGSGGPRTASDSATINLASVNDAPVNTIPGAAVTSEDTPLV
ncbi:MAG: hypothetical protein ACREQL_02400, partial [Candidatus Binatia bacterium]